MSPLNPYLTTDKQRHLAASRDAAPCGSAMSHPFWVTLARRTHPFPSRTRQLSSSAPMVLHRQLCGRVGSRPVFFERPDLTDRAFCISAMISPDSVAQAALAFTDPTDGQALKSVE